MNVPPVPDPQPLVDPDVQVVGSGELPDHLKLYEPGDIGGAIEDPTDHILVGPVGEWLQRIEPETEATRTGLASVALSGLSAWLGRDTRLSQGRIILYPNVLSVMVGKTSLGRKGTADHEAKHLLEEIDPQFVGRNAASGFGSGEALIERISDPELDKFNDLKSGTDDQRLFILEGEFAKLLRIADREGNTLGDVIRLIFDGKEPLANRTKGKALVSSRHCVSLSAGITPEELVTLFPSLAASSGTGNRYLYVWSESTRLLPEGGNPTPIRDLADRIADGYAPAGRTLTLTDSARAWWAEIYGHYRNADHVPLSLQGMATRATDQILKLALIYAAVEGRLTVDTPHLEAGKAWVDHSAATITAVLGGLVRNQTAARILGHLRDAPGKWVSRSDIWNLMSRNVTAAELDTAITELRIGGLLWTRDGDSTGGRPPTVITATTPTRRTQ